MTDANRFTSKGLRVLYVAILDIMLEIHSAALLLSCIYYLDSDFLLIKNHSKT